MVNYKLKGYILEALDNQIRDKDPKCVNETLEKLISMGYKEDRSREMVAAVLLEEIYDVLKSKKPYNEERYRNKLAMLPDYSGETIEEEFEDDFEDKLIQISIRNGNKTERNEPCPCGSGKKYKKCCGK